MIENEADHVNDELRTFDFSTESSWDFLTKTFSKLVGKTDGDIDDDNATLQVPEETQSDLRDASESIGRCEDFFDSKA